MELDVQAEKGRHTHIERERGRETHTERERARDIKRQRERERDRLTESEGVCVCVCASELLGGYMQTLGKDLSGSADWWMPVPVQVACSLNQGGCGMSYFAYIYIYR